MINILRKFILMALIVKIRNANKKIFVLIVIDIGSFKYYISYGIHG